MKVSISPENEQFIAQVVQEGTFQDRADALNAAIELLRSRSELLAHIDKGTEQLREGQSTVYDDDSLREFFDELQERGRKRYKASKKQR